MYRTLFLLAVFAPSVWAVEPLVLHRPSLPVGAVRGFGIPPQPATASVGVGGYAASGSFRVLVPHDAHVNVWAWEPPGTKPPVARLTGATATITRVVLSADGTTASAAMVDGRLARWDLATGARHDIRRQGGSVTALASDERGQRVAFAEGKTLYLYDHATQRTVGLGERPTPITTLALAGDRVAIGDAQGQITLRNGKGEHVADLPWTPLPDQEQPGMRSDPLLRLVGQPLKADPAKPLRYRHEFDHGLTKLVFAPDGKQLAAAGGTVVRVWNLNNNKVVWEHARHSFIDWGVSLALTNYVPPPRPPQQAGAVCDLAFARDGKYVASTGIHGEGWLLEAATGKVVRDLRGPIETRGTRPSYQRRAALAFGPDGTTLTLFEGSFLFAQEDLRSGQILNRVAGHQSSVPGLALSPDGKWLATFGDDQRLRVWHVQRGDCVADVAAGMGEARGLAWSPDGQWLVASGYRGLVVWQVQGDPPTLTKHNQHDGLSSLVGAFVESEPARLLVASQYRAGRLLDLADRKVHGADGFTPSTEPRDIAVNRAGTLAALAYGYSGTRGPVLWQVVNGKTGPTLEGVATLDHMDRVRFSPDGRLLVGYGGNDGFVVWDTTNGKQHFRGKFGKRPLQAAAFTPDGRVLALAGDEYLHLFEVATGRGLTSLRADSRFVLSLAFVGNTGYLASAGGDGVAYLWDIRAALAKAAPVPNDLGVGVLGHGSTTGQWAKRLPVASHVSSVAFAPDGQTLAVGGRDRVALFAWPSGQPRTNFATDPGRVLGLTYSANGKYLAVAGEYWDGQAKPVQLWDTATNKPLWVGKNTGRGPQTLCFSPDLQTLYSAGQGVRRWDVANGAAQEPWPLAPAYATAVALAPDGKRLAIAGDSTEVLILDPAAPRGARVVTASPSPHDGHLHVYAVAYSPDGQWLATGARDGTVRVWDTTDYTLRREWQAGAPESRGIACLAFAPRGDIVAVAGGPIESGLLRHVELYETQTGKLLGRLHATGPRIAWSPDGRWLATPEYFENKRDNHHVLLWAVPRLLGRP